MAVRFKHGTRRRALEYEKDWAARWKADGTFEKSVENRSVDNAYVFYDGPPFITGVPHHGTLLSSIVKDAVPRYWTMKGKRVERVWGWDCHGLPAENFVEKQLNITDRRQIVTNADQAAPLDKDGHALPTISLETYITKARESMVANSESWEGVVDRIGRWVDFKGAYRTMDKDFMESVWWAFKQLYDAGKIYEDRKVLMYDTRFASPVSKNEVTMDNDAYQTVTDPSAYVKFKVVQGDLQKKYPNTYADVAGDVYLLAWTTTPWTLPGNMALAVNPVMTYCFVKVGNDTLVIAQDALERVLRDDKNKPLEDYEIIKQVTGEDLRKIAYEPIIETKPAGERSSDTYHVTTADFVTDDSGTGIVHIAPAYGEDDYALKQDVQKHAIDIDDVLDENGFYRQDVAEKLYQLMPWRDSSKLLECWDANKDIAKGLEKAGIVWKIEYIRHEYPFNPRSKQRIMYRAIPSWFFDVQGSKPLLLEQNENITWFPDHLKHGRFMKNIEQAPDWNLSRDRFWATAMPVWKGDRGTVKVVGSYAELKELSGVELEDYHRPWVDDITFEIEGETFTRIDKVLDCWFESGSMPFAQLHYPFENQQKFEENYPADFIVEYIGQVRAWFYYVHVVNASLAEVGAFGADSARPQKNAFKNVITTGVVAGNDGRKMSKSLGNFTDPNELMDKFSADSLRFLLLASPLLKGEDFSLLDKDVGDVARKLSMIWNMYDFFTMYAEVDDFSFPYDTSSSDAFLLRSMSNTTQSDTPESSSRPGNEQSFQIEVAIEKLANPLDKWIISRVHQLNEHVTRHMDDYNIPEAMSDILPFIEDASNWYVRRSRRRFWKSDDDSDKAEAYRTLHYVLLKLSMILAPFTPFLAEELYQNLGGTESVHLLDWPTSYAVDQQVLDEMEQVRTYVNEGLSLRARAGLKVRQPLASVTVPTFGKCIDTPGILLEELNVKEVQLGDDVAIDELLTPELKREGLMREVIRHVQAVRKNAGLNVDDRINLQFTTESEDLEQAIAEHGETIKAETLTESIGEVVDGFVAEVTIESKALQVSLKKV